MYSNDDYLLDLLTEAGNLTQDEVGEALANKGRRTALEYLIETSRVSEEVVAQTMAVNSGMEFADLSGFVPDPGTLELMDAEVANKYHVLPVSFVGTRDSSCRQRPSRGSVRLRVSHQADTSANSPLERISPPSLTSKKMYGSNGCVTSAC